MECTRTHSELVYLSYCFFFFFCIIISIFNCSQVGGFDGSTGLNSAEMYDPHTHEWRMIAPMSTRRSSVGVGVVNGLLYAVSLCSVTADYSLCFWDWIYLCFYVVLIICHNKRGVHNVINCM